MNPATEPISAVSTSSRAPFAAWLVLAASAHGLLFGPVAYRLIFQADTQRGPNLFPAHISFAQDMFSAPWTIAAPDFLWLATVKTVDSLIPGPIEWAGFFAAIVFYALFGAVLFALFADTLGSSTRARCIAMGLSVAFAIMESPAVFAGWISFSQGELFLPLYLPFSATTLASLGVNVVLVWQVGRLLDGRVAHDHRWTLPALTITASVAKPNLVPMVLVAAPILALWCSPRRPPLNVGSAAGPFWLVTVPGGLITAAQLLATVMYVPNPGGWRLAPLRELADLGALTPTFWLVALAPVLLVLLYRGALLADVAVRLTLLCTAIGLVLAILLERVGTTYKGDALQLAQTSLAMAYIFMGRRVLELSVLRQASHQLQAGAIAIFGICTVAGLASWGFHVGLLVW